MHTETEDYNYSENILVAERLHSNNFGLKERPSMVDRSSKIVTIDKKTQVSHRGF
jgi:hypothetical protein